MRSLVGSVSAIAVLSVGLGARAYPVHIARPGETVTSIAVEYYGDGGRETVVRAVNGMPLQGELVLQEGEPLVIPERRHRVVGEGDSWESMAREELGTEERAWLLAQANDTDPAEPPEVGRVIVVPFLMPLAIVDGLPAIIARFFPEESPRQVARMLRRINPNLRGRVARGTRIVLPIFGLEILEARRADLARRSESLRRPEDARRQDGSSVELARLPELFAAGSYAEVVFVAGRISGCGDLTEAQRVSLHRYLGQAYVALDREDLAEEEFRRAVALQPDFQLDQVTTSPAVLEVVERVRASRHDGVVNGR